MPKQYPSELRERAVRLVIQHRTVRRQAVSVAMPGGRLHVQASVEPGPARAGVPCADGRRPPYWPVALTSALRYSAPVRGHGRFFHWRCFVILATARSCQERL